MSLTNAPEQLIGRTLVSTDGDKIGRIADVYLDDQTDAPEWLAVTTGLFGSRVSFVPLTEATTAGDDVAVPYSKDHVKDAPNAEADGHLSEQEEEALYRHYGRGHRVSGAEGTVGHDTSGPTTDSAMTRSEEELEVGKVQREAGRVRLRKHVVTEQVQTTVPVQREEVVVEREPITEGNIDHAMDGPEISSEEHEVVLHEEEVVVNKQAVPKERVRLDKQTVVEDEQVGAELRKEQIEVEDGSTRS